jgi:hypothetical protein
MSRPMTTVTAAPAKITRVVCSQAFAIQEPADRTPRLIAKSGKTS